MEIQELMKKDMGEAIEWLIDNKDKFVLMPKDPLEDDTELVANFQLGYKRVDLTKDY